MLSVTLTSHILTSGLIALMTFHYCLFTGDIAEDLGNSLTEAIETRNRPAFDNSSNSVCSTSGLNEFDFDTVLHSCRECPVMFESIRDLTAHLMMHAMLKPFSCGHCLQPFSEADETKQHFYNTCSLLHSEAPAMN